MPLQAQQICTLARQDARCPGFTSQSGQILNAILSDLCQTYDFDLTKQTYNFTFNTSQLNSLGQAYQNLPANYLRGIRNESFYTISGVPYPMIPCDLEEFDMLVEQAGLSNFPVFFTVDMSLSGMTNGGTTGVPVMLFWMPPSGAYPATVRYFSQMPDITTPETSTTVPWFPNQRFLRKRLAADLMQLTDDERQTKWQEEANDLLKHYLFMKDDKADRVETVKLDRRRFGTNYMTLKNTKKIGW